jgi:hypothetical protein
MYGLSLLLLLDSSSCNLAVGNYSSQTEREWYLGILLAAEDAIGFLIPELSEVREDVLGKRSGRATD